MSTEPQTRVSNLDRRHSFSFRCGSGLTCFTECCRQLELALTPYDVLRLRESLRLSGAEFLERYTVIEQGEDNALPQVYLGMVDDGRASCPFVSPTGCTVYANRPGACRTYPLGRGARLDQEQGCNDFYVLVNEPHCRGFAEPNSQTVDDWLADQGVTPYNEMNDLCLRILQHPRIRAGFRPGAGEQERYLEVLYRLDGFTTPPEATAEERLRLGLLLLADELFPR